jgi:RHH-type proline utilization regulon transcriptional repressor/proline dehydrogenase/delta 1-pyrroline-5-carboxylate dehydrogenase
VSDAAELAARELARLGAEERAGLFHLSWWSDRLLGMAMGDAGFRAELLRFVDVYPATAGPEDVVEHLRSYLGGPATPGPVRSLVSLAGAVPVIGPRAADATARRMIERLARQFIVGADTEHAFPALRALWDGGIAATVDLLGEKTVVAADADRYAARVLETLNGLRREAASWPVRPVLESDDLGPLSRVNLSVKASALAPHLAPLTAEDGLAEAAGRLRPLLHAARDADAFVYLDAEHHAVRDLNLRLARTVLDEPELRGVPAGIVVQAYARDAVEHLVEIIDWSAVRPAPITVRLVKGAYWDAETVAADAAGWPSPLFTEKAETDANYERCVDLLHDAHGRVRAAFGTHNLRSIGSAIASARARGIADDGYELQLLYGMAEPIQAAIQRSGHRLRVYAPIGELVPGMAYLVRRILENTSNEGFVRRSFAEHRGLGDLLRSPGPPPPSGRLPLAARPPTDADQPETYRPEPVAEWHRDEVRAAMGAAVEAAMTAPPMTVRALIEGRWMDSGETMLSTDPADPAHVVARVASCSASDADRAVAAAEAAFPAWASTPAGDRAAVLFRAAAELRSRRHGVAALEVVEAGKPWDEADADVAEAIDFCEYYGREMLRLDRGGTVDSPPGEANSLRYRGKGVAVVISPWNFPLAIPTGMTVAALVTGNTVILKPAEQTPAIAACLVEALVAAGAPAGTIQLLPGRGEAVGARLVEHPGVALVAFTGSRQVGLEINRLAAVRRQGERSIKRVITELGGKNAMIVDDDADLDVAVPDIVRSAFGYSGQKCSACSRLILLDGIHDVALERVVAATVALRVGRPAAMGTQVGPLIDAEAHDHVRDYVELAGREGTLVLHRTDVPDEGWYVGPSIVTGVDPATSRVANEEVFGPLLAVFRARDLDEAIALANATDYALTAGVHTRSPDTVRRAGAELRAGNIYVNRAITGAVVGRQPFGGFGLSGVGSKAGGPDYLLQFVDPVAVSENTLRQGFV